MLFPRDLQKEVNKTRNREYPSTLPVLLPSSITLSLMVPSEMISPALACTNWTGTVGVETTGDMIRGTFRYLVWDIFSFFFPQKKKNIIITGHEVLGFSCMIKGRVCCSYIFVSGFTGGFGRTQKRNKSANHINASLSCG